MDWEWPSLTPSLFLSSLADLIATQPDLQKYDDDEEKKFEEKFGSGPSGYEEDVGRPANLDLPGNRRRRSEKAKLSVKEFLRHVENNSIDEFYWPPDSECPSYKYGMMHYYLKEYEFEKDNNIDENNKDLKIARLFLAQVRNSWGYDVNCCPPEWLPSPFVPIDIHDDAEWLYYGNWVMTAVWCAIKRINAGAKEEGICKSYVPEEILNAVVAPPGGPCLMLLTLVLKEVESKDKITVRATVSLPICYNAEIEECKLVSSLPHARLNLVFILTNSVPD